MMIVPCGCHISLSIPSLMAFAGIRAFRICYGASICWLDGSECCVAIWSARYGDYGGGGCSRLFLNLLALFGFLPRMLHGEKTRNCRRPARRPGMDATQGKET